MQNECFYEKRKSWFKTYNIPFLWNCLIVKCNDLISTEIRYKPCFSGYTGINRSPKTL